MYDVIVLGATFAAAGIAQLKKETCLILEQRPQAGYEFLSALHFGTDYQKPVTSRCARALYEKFQQKQAFTEDRICLYDCAAPFYQLLEGLPVLLNTQLIAVENTGDSFICTTHGVAGYRTFEAKQIVDTRCAPGMYLSKTYNLLIDGTGPVSLPPDVTREPWGFSRNYVLRCAVPPDADYITAREKAMAVIRALPQQHKLLQLADDFDYRVKGGYPKTENGILYLPSKAYPNPIQALDAGACLAGEGTV